MDFQEYLHLVFNFSGPNTARLRSPIVTDLSTAFTGLYCKSLGRLQAFVNYGVEWPFLFQPLRFTSSAAVLNITGDENGREDDTYPSPLNQFPCDRTQPLQVLTGVKVGVSSDRRKRVGRP